MIIFYTTQEGGKYEVLDVDLSQELIIAYLRNNHDKEAKRTSFYMPLNQEHARRVDVHSVIFPDGFIWDSHFKGERPGGNGKTIYTLLLAGCGKADVKEGKKAILNDKIDRLVSFSEINNIGTYNPLIMGITAEEKAILDERFAGHYCDFMPSRDEYPVLQGLKVSSITQRGVTIFLMEMERITPKENPITKRWVNVYLEGDDTTYEIFKTKEESYADDNAIAKVEQHFINNAWVNIKPKESPMLNLRLHRAITFDEFIKHGLENGATAENGIPWSWKINGKTVTHENDNRYIIETLDGYRDFERGNMLIAFEAGLRILNN